MICIDCGGKVPAKRLAAMPDATRCVPCQEEVDEVLVAGPSAETKMEEMNGADFSIARRRVRQDACVRANEDAAE